MNERNEIDELKRALFSQSTSRMKGLLRKHVINFFNNSTDGEFLIQDFEITEGREGINIYLIELIDRKTRRYVYEESLVPEETDPFEKDVENFIQEKLGYHIQVRVDPKFYGK